jgi:hypothetical protein
MPDHTQSWKPLGVVLHFVHMAFDLPRVKSYRRPHQLTWGLVDVLSGRQRQWIPAKTPRGFDLVQMGATQIDFEFSKRFQTSK